MSEPSTELHWAVQAVVRAMCDRLDGHSEFPGATLEVYDVDHDELTVRVHTFGPMGPTEVYVFLTLGDVRGDG